MPTRIDSERNVLTVGWQVTSTLDPRYWLNSSAKPGQHVPEDLVHVAAPHIGRHTLIVAQSGSGKSFFLGRLIEEILLRTHSRCVILDPNADFRRVNEIEGFFSLGYRVVQPARAARTFAT